jgi:hypothetical protein
VPDLWGVPELAVLTGLRAAAHGAVSQPLGTWPRKGLQNGGPVQGGAASGGVQRSD